ncbi:unnamed protein product [Linum trigynum]|uniref:Uncharacterized protein n=1 Tax=Linum trigynum TaxID=586398 RepID=A0AAV2G4U7_9ROSI
MWYASTYIDDFLRKLRADEDPSKNNLMVKLQEKRDALLNESDLLAQLKSDSSTNEVEDPGLNDKAIKDRSKRQKYVELELGQVDIDTDKLS